MHFFALPHTGGGYSGEYDVQTKVNVTLPHTGGGYSTDLAIALLWQKLCPTQVGVTLLAIVLNTRINALPHTGGGYSGLHNGIQTMETTLPHTGGGYSVTEIGRYALYGFAPHRWGLL